MITCEIHQDNPEQLNKNKMTNIIQYLLSNYREKHKQKYKYIAKVSVNTGKLSHTLLLLFYIFILLKINSFLYSIS